jgi:hypothetical protein
MTFIRTILLSGVVSISISSFGQQLFYKDKLVDTLKIASNISGYHFDSAGTTTGTYDEIVISYNGFRKKYLASYDRTLYTTTYKPDTQILVIKHRWKNKSISSQKLHSLITAFENPYIRPTTNDIGLTLKQLKRYTTKADILRIAKKNGVGWRFEEKYYSYDSRKVIYDGCQHIDTFKLYLNEVYDSSQYTVVTDYSNTITVKLISDSIQFLFEGKYPFPYKQPWFNKTGEFRYWPKSILNFQINSTLIDILPKDFTNRETIEIRALIDDYLKWYLHKVGYLWKYS